MSELWKEPLKPILGFPSSWFYAETDGGKFLLVPIGGGEIRLSDSLDGGCDLCNEKSVKHYIRNYRIRTKDNKTNFAIKKTIVLL